MLLCWLCDTCRTAAAFLQEGSLDARTYGKRLLWAVKTVLRGIGSDMARLMTGVCGHACHCSVTLEFELGCGLVQKRGLYIALHC